jgi:hypothetical protein
MPNYASLANDSCGLYYNLVSGSASDVLGLRILNDTSGEPNFTAAAAYMPPQRDYAHIGSVAPYQKYSVSPDGRIKTGDGAIYTPTLASKDPGPGQLVFDPATVIPWPATNFSVSKSALVGSHLRVVAVTSFDPDTGAGFEEVAFGTMVQQQSVVYVRARGVVAGEAAPQPFLYFTASNASAAAPLDPASFYIALWQEQLLWNSTFSTAPSFVVPGQVCIHPCADGETKHFARWLAPFPLVEPAHSCSSIFATTDRSWRGTGTHAFFLLCSVMAGGFAFFSPVVLRDGRWLCFLFSCCAP